jgi:hypothetical protein
MAIFHHDVVPLVIYEIADNSIYVLPRDLTIRENAFDCLGDSAQTCGALLVFASEIADLRCSSGIPNL